MCVMRSMGIYSSAEGNEPLSPLCRFDCFNCQVALSWSRLSFRDPVAVRLVPTNDV